MWNKLRARHYSVLILLAIVTLETSAIGIDRLLARQQDDVAFQLDSQFQNNNFLHKFKVAEARSNLHRINQAPHLPPIAEPAEVSTKQRVEADFIAASREEPGNGTYVEYAVRKGDSLAGIATLFGMNSESIAQANRLSNKHAIRAGQTLRVPVTEPRMIYNVQKGDSLAKIANRFGLSMKDILEANALKSHRLAEHQKLTIPMQVRKPALKIIRMDQARAPKMKDLKIVSTSGSDRTSALTMVSTSKLTLVGPEKAVLKIIKPTAPNREKVVVASIKSHSQAAASGPSSSPEVQAIAGPTTTKPNTTTTPIATQSEPKKGLEPKPAKKIETRGTKAREIEAREIEYRVAKGDSLSLIASRHNTTVAALMKGNDLQTARLRIGQSLKITPDKQLFRVVSKVTKTKEEAPKVTMVRHTVTKGDCLSLLARKYNTTVAQIVKTNNLKQSLLSLGQQLTVPQNKRLFNVKNVTSRKQAPGWSWPVSGTRRIGDRYGWRMHPVYRRRLFHAGIDIPAPRGTSIFSARAGKVIFAGWRRGYGKLVIVRHSDGYTTRYGHCSSHKVRTGQSVRAGQVIATVGATGVATGNHLHFEVRKMGKTQNPVLFLRR